MSIELNITEINDAFKSYSISIDELLSVDDTSFYYERGGSKFPYNHNEEDIDEVINGLAEADSVFTQTFRKKEQMTEIVGSSPSVLTQIQCYLMICNKSNNDRVALYCGIDPSDSLRNTVQSFLPNLTSYLFSFIYNNQSNINKVDGVVKYGDKDLTEYLLENDNRIKEIDEVIKKNSNVVTYSLNYNFDIVKNGNIGNNLDNSISICTLEIVFNNSENTYVHKIKTYFDKDEFIKTHKGSINSIEILAYNSPTTVNGKDNLLYYGDDVYNTIDDNGGRYNITDVELDKFIAKHYTSDRKYHRHDKVIDIYLNRLVFKASNIDSDRSEHEFGIAQRFMIFHSMNDTSQLNSLNQVVKEKIFKYIRETAGTEFNNERLKKVYPNLNFFSYFIFRAFHNVSLNHNEPVWKCNSAFNTDLPNSQKHKVFYTPINNLNDQNINKADVLGYYSSPTDPTQSDNPFVDYTNDTEIGLNGGSNELDLMRIGILRLKNKKINNTNEPWVSELPTVPINEFKYNSESGVSMEWFISGTNVYGFVYNDTFTGVFNQLMNLAYDKI